MIDALGRDVPEWAREAFAILSADGRRVYVGTADMKRRDGDAVIQDNKVILWGGEGSERGGAWDVHVRADTCIPHMPLADAARRALAMEAERKWPRQLARDPMPDDPSFRIDVNDPKYRPPMTFVRAPWQFVDLNGDVHTMPEPRKHNATCAHCGGPAYHGLFSATCLREGGCKTVDERVYAEPPTVSLLYRSRTADGFDLPAAGREPYHVAFGNGVRAEHPTVSGALAAWREARREQERGR